MSRSSRAILPIPRIPLVRVHLQDTLGDVIGVKGQPVAGLAARRRDRAHRQEEDTGVIVVLREQESSRDFIDAVEGLGGDSTSWMSAAPGDGVLRTYGVGAQILRDLGLSKIRVLSAPKHMYAISGFDLEITEYVES